MAQIKVYEDAAGEWRWRKVSGGNVVADSGEGYESKDGALSAAEKEAGEGDTVVVEEG